MTHTSRPWRIRRHYFGDEEICFVPVEILGGNGKLIVAQYGGLTPFGQEWTVEDIEGNGSLIVAAPDMLEALEEVKNELDAYVPTCPLCGGSAASGHKYNCLWHVVNAAIRKARGEE